LIATPWLGDAGDGITRLTPVQFIPYPVTTVHRGIADRALQLKDLLAPDDRDADHYVDRDERAAPW
jgi:hypothetical protein